MQTYTLSSTTAGWLVLGFCVVATLGMLWLVFVSERVRGNSGLRFFLSVVLLLGFLLDYYVVTMTYFQFHSVALQEDGQTFRVDFLWPRGSDLHHSDEVAEVQVLEMWYRSGGRKKSTLTLVLKGEGSEIVRSAPSKQKADLLEAAERISKASGANLTRWSRKGRMGDLRSVEEFVVPP